MIKVDDHLIKLYFKKFILLVCAMMKTVEKNGELRVELQMY